ncbi:MAG: hypothetical protein ACKVOM_08300 [Ferruginibacter sp.]
MAIKYLKHAEIDKGKWDECIIHSSNSLIFAYSFYLDIMVPNWNAIVINDYEFVFPLPIKKKWGIRYIYIPPLTPQLGLFGKNPLPNIEVLLPLLKSKVRYGDIFLNYANTINSSIVKRRTNFILNLKDDYQSIYKCYAADLKRILRKNVKNDMVYCNHQKIEFTVNLYKENYAFKTPNVSDDDYKKFLDVCHLLETKNNCFTRSMCDNDGSILCSIICLADEKRIYIIMNSSTESGRKKEASTFLYDELIKEFCGSGKLIDYAGSDVPGVHFFVNKFCPVNEPVFFYHYNNLPGFLKLFKH